MVVGKEKVMSEIREMFQCFGIVFGVMILGMGIPGAIVYGIGGLFFGYT